MNLPGLNILAKLEGKEFRSREELDDAVYAFYSTLNLTFEAGHREFVDRLISATYITQEDGKFVVHREPTIKLDEKKLSRTPDDWTMYDSYALIYLYKHSRLVCPITDPRLSTSLAKLIALGWATLIDDNLKMEQLREDAAKAMATGNEAEAITLLTKLRELRIVSSSESCYILTKAGAEHIETVLP
jgi:hypothetical protein